MIAWESSYLNRYSSCKFCQYCTGQTYFSYLYGPLRPDGNFITGVGTDLSIEEGYEAARLTGINQIAILKSALGDLKRVKRIVRATGMVNASPDLLSTPVLLMVFRT